MHHADRPISPYHPHYKHYHLNYTLCLQNMPKLDATSAAYLDKVLKHYPMPSEEGTAPHKYPQQHMHDYRKERQIYDRPTAQKLDSMRLFKEEGNNHYKNQRYKEASYFYQKVIIYGDYTFPQHEKDCETMDELLQQANCNLGMCLVKVNEWETARVNFNEASKGKNAKVKAKALYWLAKYYLRVAKSEEAVKAIRNISQLGHPHNDCVPELQNLLKSTAQTNGQSQKELCANMFK